MKDDKRDDNSIDAIDDFLTRYKKSVRHTETVRTYRINNSAPKNVNFDENSEKDDSFADYIDRTKEIDPRATFNPVIQRHIVAKKIRTPEDDEDDIKQFTYEQRFEKQPQLPDDGLNSQRTVTFNAPVSDTDSLDGQQSFFDKFSNINDNGERRIIAPKPKEQKTEEVLLFDELDFDLGDDIESLFSSLSKEHKFEIGKSEKLRAIARTVGDEGDTVNEKQISFHEFEQVKPNVVDEEEIERDLKRNRKSMVSAFMNKGGVNKYTDDKIEYDGLLNVNEKELQKKEKAEAFNSFQKDLTDFIDTHQGVGEEPEIEYNRENDSEKIAQFISRKKKNILFRILTSAIPGSILLIISLFLVSSANSGNIPPLTTVKTFIGISFVFLCLSAVFVFIDFGRIFKQLKNKKFSAGLLFYLMYFFTAIQTGILFFNPQRSDSSLLILVPTVLMSVLPLFFARYIIYDNLKLCFNLYSSDEVHNVLKAFGDSGLASQMLSGVKNSGGEKVKYSAKASFVTGFMKCAVNAVPLDPYADMFSFVYMFLSVLAGIVTGIVKADALIGFTVAAGSFILCSPTTYVFNAAVALINENRRLKSKKASVVSYAVAKDISSSTGLILDASDIIEQNSCSIHGVKPFNSFSAVTATQYAASVVIKAKTPLEGIFRQVIAQSELEILETEQLVYEEKLGVSTWINNNRVLFGSLDFMRHHNISIPSNYETATGNRKTVFLSVNDTLCAQFIVSYHIKRSVASFLRDITGRGMSLLINTVDQNITESFIEEKCRLPENSVKVISVRIGEYFRQFSENVENTVPVSAISDGKITSLAMLFASSFKLCEIRRITAIISYICSGMGIFFIALFGFLNGLDVIGNWQIIVFKLFWIVLGLVVPLFIKK